MAKTYETSYFCWDDELYRKYPLILDFAPPVGLVNKAMSETGPLAQDASVVAVPFGSILGRSGLSPDRWWRGDSTERLRVPVGPAGAMELHYFDLGKKGEFSHSALVVGRPRSGKTNLIHVIITGLALTYPPDEVELYMIDFKEGVAFRPYADENLPHARVIAIESDREFGLSVLRKLVEEFQRRAKAFGETAKQCGVAVEDIYDYRTKTGAKMPRILLVIDEFQEFFMREDRINRDASAYLDALIRKGPAFGVHVLLATQTLSGAYKMPDSTKEQVNVRIALPCSEKDARIIFADDNNDAAHLSRSGEAIYNAMAGRPDGNTPFQVALFTDEDKKNYLSQLREKALGLSRAPVPMVFDGSKSVPVSECRDLVRSVVSPHVAVSPRVGVSAWCGLPVAVDDPVSVRFSRKTGSNLLVVDTDEDQAMGAMGAMLLGLLAQHSPESARFLVSDLTAPECLWSERLNRMKTVLPHRITFLHRSNLLDTISALCEEADGRMDGKSSTNDEIYLVIQGLQRVRDLRAGSIGLGSIDPSEGLRKLLREGSEGGVHVLCWVDDVRSLVSKLDRSSISEFGYRLAGSMSASDSNALIDSDAASTMNRNDRMVFYDIEKPSATVKLRPFAYSDETWFGEYMSRVAAKFKTV